MYHNCLIEMCKRGHIFILCGGWYQYQPLEMFHVEIRSWCLEDWKFCGQIQHARDEDQLYVLCRESRDANPLVSRVSGFETCL